MSVFMFLSVGLFVSWENKTSVDFVDFAQGFSQYSSLHSVLNLTSGVGNYFARRATLSIRS